MKETFKYGVLYFIAYAISGCNYKVFNLFLTGNSLLFVGCYSGVTALILLTPIYSFAEKIIFPKDNNQSKGISKQDCKSAIKNYSWALILSMICSVVWQGITYGYLIKYGPLLALLVTTLSRLLTPILSSYVFGDAIQNKFWYWLGLIVSLLGLLIYQIGGGDYHLDNNLNWGLYCLLSFTSLSFMVISNIVKRFTTSDPSKDSIPVKKAFLGVHYLNKYHIPVKVREFIVNTSTFLILLLVGLYLQFFSSITDNERWFNELVGVAWIGIIGGIAYTISVKLTNRISNVTTAAIDGLRPLASYFLFPFVGLVLAGISYSLNTKTAEIFGYNIPCLSLFGILICCIGVTLSLQLGKPKKSNQLKVENV
ncbi:MAG: hypothetical protein IPI96_14970 [Saprospiraceae bacterium]|nr:hypothetical protein [Saprospiraceae bacterium]